MSEHEKHSGSCLCGAVIFEIHGPLRHVTCCHCTQCRKITGHFMAATACRDEDLRLLKDEGLAWYRSSSSARRGFCNVCGSTLFWKRNGASTISIAAGALDGPTGLSLEDHIFCADKGDYYDIPGDAPRHEKWPE